MSSSTSASDLPGFCATSARRYSSASYSASCCSAGSSPASAAFSCSRYCSTERGAERDNMTISWSVGAAAAWGSARKQVHEVAGLLPDLQPLLKYGATVFGDAVIAAGRSGVRGHYTAGQEAARAHVAQNRVERTLLEGIEARRDRLQLLGDLVAIQVVFRPLQYRQQHESDQPHIQFPLKLLFGGLKTGFRFGFLVAY